MEALDLLNLIVASHVDSRAVMDVLRHDLEHAPHLAIDGLAAGCCAKRLVSTLSTYSREKEKQKKDKDKVGLNNSPFSNTRAIGAHSYRMRSFPLGLFLSAG